MSNGSKMDHPIIRICTYLETTYLKIRVAEALTQGHIAHVQVLTHIHTDTWSEETKSEGRDRVRMQCGQAKGKKQRLPAPPS